MDLLISDKYQITKKLGAGSFGEIYFAYDVETKEEFAVKLENSKTKLPQLLYEVKLYKILAGGIGIPNIYWYGVVDNYN